MDSPKQNKIILVGNANLGQVKEHFRPDFTSRQLHPKFNFKIVDLTEEGFDLNWRTRPEITKEIRNLDISPLDFIVIEGFSDSLIGTDPQRDCRTESLLPRSLLVDLHEFLDSFENKAQIIILGPLPRRTSPRINCECNRLRILNKVMQFDILLKEAIKDRPVSLLTHYDFKESEPSTPTEYFYSKAAVRDIQNGVKFGTDMSKVIAWYLKNVIIKTTVNIPAEIFNYLWEEEEKGYLLHWGIHKNLPNLPFVTTKFKTRTNIKCCDCHLETYRDQECKYCSEFVEAHNTECLGKFRNHSYHDDFKPCLEERYY